MKNCRNLRFWLIKHARVKLKPIYAHLPMFMSKTFFPSFSPHFSLLCSRFYDLCSEKSVSRLSKNERKSYRSKIDLDRPKKHLSQVLHFVSPSQNIKCKFYTAGERGKKLCFFPHLWPKIHKVVINSCNRSASEFGCLKSDSNLYFESHLSIDFFSFHFFHSSTLPRALRFVSFALCCANINQTA